MDPQQAGRKLSGTFCSPFDAIADSMFCCATCARIEFWI
jgi:hypothetical protein